MGQQNVSKKVKNLKTNLLGSPAIAELQLIEQLHNICISPDSVRQFFPDLFTGLVSNMKSNSKPYVLHTACQILIMKELDQMQSMEVISLVNNPSPWCDGIVVVPKPSVVVMICKDLKPLNQNVVREYHPLPNLYETLPQLIGATKFSKLNANSGFWQIPLVKTTH